MIAADLEMSVLVRPFLALFASIGSPHRRAQRPPFHKRFREHTPRAALDGAATRGLAALAPEDGCMDGGGQNPRDGPLAFEGVLASSSGAPWSAYRRAPIFADACDARAACYKTLIREPNRCSQQQQHSQRCIRDPEGIVARSQSTLRCERI